MTAIDAKYRIPRILLSGALPLVNLRHNSAVGYGVQQSVADAGSTYEDLAGGIREEFSGSTASVYDVGHRQERPRLTRIRLRASRYGVTRSSPYLVGDPPPRRAVRLKVSGGMPWTRLNTREKW